MNVYLLSRHMNKTHSSFSFQVYALQVAFQWLKKLTKEEALETTNQIHTFMFISQYRSCAMTSETDER